MNKDRQPRRRPRSERTDSSNVQVRQNDEVARKSQKSVFKPMMYFFIFSLLAILVYFGLYIYTQRLLRRIITPPDVKKVIAETDRLTGGADRFWGSYRPQAYFGLKTRSPQSPVLGLMWFSQSVQQLRIRHWCDHGDRLKKYGWTAHDGRSFGRQEIVDDTYSLTTEFVKRPGGDHGGDWTGRIKVHSLAGQENIVSLMFYIALDGSGELTEHVKKNRLARITGQTDTLGNFQIEFPRPGKNLQKIDYLITHADSVDRLKETVEQHMTWGQWNRGGQANYIALAGRSIPAGKTANFLVVQYTVTPPFEMEVVFQSGSFEQRKEQLAGTVFDEAIDSHVKVFDEKFEDVFALKAKGFSLGEINLAKSALSNMLGGIGYFHGSSLVQSAQHQEPVNYWTAPLYTAVPSRSFFPRGFLWDEGFHNLLISKWDKAISKDIIGHWLDLMNMEGWIPREQILGAEARAKVPKEFVVQKNTNANPPTLFLPLQALVHSMARSDDPADKAYLKRIYPRLQVWYNWYNSSQAGAEASTYRWRGRDATSLLELNPKTLTSGLDDYPRASHPTDQERHLDLRCWMALASSIMADIAEAVQAPSDVYAYTHAALTDEFKLNALHWSPKAQRYCDYGLHTDHVKLERPFVPPPQPGHQPPVFPKERKTLQPPKLQFVESYGYVSLFPFLLQIIKPTSSKLGSILRDLGDTNLLWTDFGLRSLAKNAPLYMKHNTEHDPPYWRGAIWMNMNYLAVRALHYYANEDGPHRATAKDLYVKLRHNLIQNLYRVYKSTGYIWEQYDDRTGDGKGTHPFTGWSALILLIMAESY